MADEIGVCDGVEAKAIGGPDAVVACPRDELQDVLEVALEHSERLQSPAQISRDVFIVKTVQDLRKERCENFGGSVRWLGERTLWRVVFPSRLLTNEIFTGTHRVGTVNNRGRFWFCFGMFLIGEIKE